MTWNTTRVVAMWSEKEVLSNVWWPVRVKDILEAEKALALWLDSSLGILSILAHRTSTEGRLGWHEKGRPGRAARVGHAQPNAGSTQGLL